jgi:G:T-mismatch repair DNA endonuclease (very short patch repair protein)
MPDFFTKAKRSQVMSRICGRGNKETDLALMRLFRRQGTGDQHAHRRFESRTRAQILNIKEQPVAGDLHQINAGWNYFIERPRLN